MVTETIDMIINVVGTSAIIALVFYLFFGFPKEIIKPIDEQNERISKLEKRLNDIDGMEYIDDWCNGSLL